MNMGGIILAFIGVVLVFAGFNKTYQNWYNTFTGKTVGGISTGGFSNTPTNPVTSTVTRAI